MPAVSIDRYRKQRYRPTGELKAFPTAARFCRLFDEIRALFGRSRIATNASHSANAGASIGIDLPS